MTLITAINTESALLIVADKRGRDNKRGVVDNLTKLVPLAQWAVGGATNRVRWLDRHTYAPQFDVCAVMREFFQDQPSVDQSINDFADHLIQAFGGFCNNYNPSLANLVGTTIFQVIIYCGYGNDLIRHQLRFDLQPDKSLMLDRESGPCQDSRLYADGDIDVVTELLHGHDHRFDDLRAKGPVVRLRSNLTPPLGTVTENEALSLCRWLIRTSSKRYLLLKPSEEYSPVGPSTNSILIGADGFRWTTWYELLRRSIALFKR